VTEHRDALAFVRGKGGVRHRSMGDRWRLDLVERSVLEAMDEFGAQPDRPHMIKKSAVP
jgi:hypothetical protein